MRRSPNMRVERFRIMRGEFGTSVRDGNNGAFSIPCKVESRRRVLHVICSDGGGWDHVSVSLPTRCPTWDEMAFVKGLFFRDDECAVQFHPPREDYVNNHPFCLHLWRSQSEEMPRPPWLLVGVKGLEAER